MPPKRGRRARAAAQPRVRAARPEASNESVHVENLEVVAPAGQPQVNGLAANEMAMFEELLVTPPQHQPPPPPPPYPMQAHPMHAHGQGTTYLVAIRYLKDVSIEFFGGKSNSIATDNWRKKLERKILTMFVVLKSTEDFKTEFSRKYFPKEAMYQMENEFSELRQGNMTVK
ncbi:unnamed protein product [Arabidopsis halleri]